MSYTYRRDFHELWSTPKSGPLLTQSISLKNSERLGIEQFLLVTNTENVRSPTVILPDTSSHLVLRQLENGRFRCRFIGPRTSSIFIDRKKRLQTYIIRFQADSARQYLPFPVAEITDQSIDLMALVSQEEKALFLEKISQDTPETILPLLINCFYHKFLAASNKRFPIAHAFLHLYRKSVPNLTVQVAAKEIGISERYLLKICKEQIGVSTKMALKILRFQHSLLSKQQYPNRPWSQIAQMAGYFDQSHMIDEYQQFLGNSPGRFFDF